MDPRTMPALWTPRQTHIWKSATFTVPIEVTEERVRFSADKYRLKFGKALETQGYNVLHMEQPKEDRSVAAAGTTDPDRRRYQIWAKVTRRPVEIRVDVPDADIPIYEKAGFKHA
ncbi:MAG: hypothetical protein O2854_03880 [Chloroflexi bacterium]|nr:hypothetical protein [Chloroflexota bacterium]